MGREAVSIWEEERAAWVAAWTPVVVYIPLPPCRFGG